MVSELICFDKQKLSVVIGKAIIHYSKNYQGIKMNTKEEWKEVYEYSKWIANREVDLVDQT